MRPFPRELIARRIEAMSGLDGITGIVQRAVRRAVPQESELKDALSGTWLGHPVHPLLTDVVIGAWTSAWFLDLLGGEETRAASDQLVGIGILAAVPTAAAGLSDWAELGGGARRVGAVHAAGNTSALTFYTLSWLARKAGRRRLGVLLSMLGSAAATFAGFLGGHLTYAKGVGVDQTAFEQLPQVWTAVLDESELVSGELAVGRARWFDVLLYRADGRIHAILDRCTHRGCALHRGTTDGQTVTCPCHGSRFRLEDGALVKGPATAPQVSFEARVRDGKVEVRPRG
jgi:nitrite reductase/ring-hydroxylating ferredoxin subunit/uncharacterized membrane protein